MAGLQPITETTGKDLIVGKLPTAMLLAGLWWVLTNGSLASWLVGLPAVAGAVWVNARLSGTSGLPISLGGLVRFVPFFLWHSLRGGVDVALRTLAPRPRIRPGFIRYRAELNTSPARTLFVTCISLLPGTLAADINGQWLEIHVLDTGSEPHAELTRLEHVVARVFADTGGA